MHYSRTLQEEIELVNRRDTPINDSARLRVPVACSILRIGREEAGVMTFTADDDRKLRGVWLVGDHELRERLSDPRHFLAHDNVELSL